MNSDDIYTLVFASDLFKKWHWYRYHFEQRLRGRDHPFAKSFVNACLTVENALPGYSKDMIDRLAAISGIEKHEPHYEQLLQLMAELLMLKRVVTFEWPDLVRIVSEFMFPAEGKKPEVVIQYSNVSLFVEVKTPALLEHRRRRATYGTQLPGRAFPKEDIDKIPGAEQGLTLPRDNAVKDFLLSANEKFASIPDSDRDRYNVLVIVWDDFIYEPITSLLHPICGLFTPDSFARSVTGGPLTFDMVDGVIIVRHLHQFQRCLADQTLVDGYSEVFSYSAERSLPQIYVKAPWGKELPELILQCFDAVPPSPEIGAECNPQDIVFWLPSCHNPPRDK